MTRLELEQAEITVHYLPKIAYALESIAKSLEVLRDNQCGKQCDQPKPREDYV